MLKDITLGQYFPGHSPIHRMDPRTKLILLVVYILTLFLAQGWLSYGLMLLVLITVICISQIPFKAILRGMKPLVMILVFTGILNLFFTKEGPTILRIWKLTITLGGLTRAVMMMARILMLITGTFLLTYTTSPIALTDGLESLMGPLKKLHVPVHELSMMMCIADGLVALAALDVHHSADAAGVVLKLGVIQAEGRGVFRIMFHCLSHPCRKIKILTTAAHSAASDTEKQKRRPKGADTPPLERLCSGTYNYTER